MSILDEVANAVGGAESSEGGSGIAYGTYTLVIERIVVKKGTKGLMFIPEFRVKESAPALNELGQPSTPNPVGATVGYPCNMGKKPAAANARAFILALMEKDESKSPETDAMIGEKMRAWCQSNQPLRGVQVKASTWPYQIAGGPNAGKFFPRVKFTLVPGQTKDTIAASRAALDKAEAGKVQAQAVAVAATPKTSTESDPLSGMF